MARLALQLVLVVGLCAASLPLGCLGRPGGAPPAAASRKKLKRNLLFVICDDLRPMFRPFTARYGVRAPNLAALALDSMVFNFTFVQQAVCGPSRNRQAGCPLPVARGQLQRSLPAQCHRVCSC